MTALLQLPVVLAKLTDKVAPELVMRLPSLVNDVKMSAMPPTTFDRSFTCTSGRRLLKESCPCRKREQ